MRNKLSPKIWLSPPHMSGKEQEFVNEAFLSNWIAPVGPHITQFEKSLTEFTKSKYAVALASGTSAIHLALKCLAIKPNDIIFCSTFTFIATANPIIYENAIPYFIESEAQTWNMCPIALEKAIKKAIEKGFSLGAILIVHLYGNPAQMTKIKVIAAKYNLPIIEDAAESLGSKYQNQACGSLTEIGIISFNGNKIITTSGGGALLTNNEAFAHKTTYLATQAKEDTLHYEHKTIGYNYRMSNVSAAIGCGQMTVIEEYVAKRRGNFELYKNLLKSKNITFQTEDANSFSNRWLTTVIFENDVIKDKVQDALLSQNIECRPLWKPLHTQPVFENCLYEGDNFSVELFKKGLCLPSGSNLETSDIEMIVEVILTCF